MLLISIRQWCKFYFIIYDFNGNKVELAMDRLYSLIKALNEEIKDLYAEVQLLHHEAKRRAEIMDMIKYREAKVQEYKILLKFRGSLHYHKV